MANANTIQQINNLVQGNVTSLTAFATDGGTSTTRAVLSMIPDISGGLFDGRPFLVSAFLKVTGSSDTTYKTTLYWNSGDNTNLTTVTDDVEIATTGTSYTFDDVSGQVVFQVMLSWDSVSEELSGIYTTNNYANEDGTIVVLNSGAGTAVANPVSSVTGTSDINFALFGEFGTTGSTNTAELVEFSISQL